MGCDGVGGRRSGTWELRKTTTKGQSCGAARGQSWNGRVKSRAFLGENKVLFMTRSVAATIICPTDRRAQSGGGMVEEECTGESDDGGDEWERLGAKHHTLALFPAGASNPQPAAASWNFWRTAGRSQSARAGLQLSPSGRIRKFVGLKLSCCQAPKTVRIWRMISVAFCRPLSGEQTQERQCRIRAVHRGGIVLLEEWEENGIGVDFASI